MKNIFLLLFITSTGICQAQEAAMRLPNPKAIEGMKIFNQSCKSCHGPMQDVYIIVSSTNDIKAAINSVPKMKERFSGKFKESELEALVAAFNSPSVPIPDSPADPKSPKDKKVANSDARLYALAKKYFPGEEGHPPPKRIFRLTRLQLDQSVRALLPFYFKESIMAKMPKDSLVTNYEFSENLFIHSVNFPLLTAWIAAIAGRVKFDPEGLFACKEAPNLDKCHLEKAEKFLQTAFRGDIDSARKKSFLNFFATQKSKIGFEAAAGDFVEVVLNSPAFLYRNETTTSEGGVLTQSQLTSQVSFSFADTLPEALGIPSGSDPSSVSSKILESRQGRGKLLRFFLSWLEIKDPGDFKISGVVNKQFTPEVARALVADFRRTLHLTLSRPAPKIDDVIMAKDFFPSSVSDFIYKGSGSPPGGEVAVAQDATRRSGLFSHPAFIASHSGPTSTRPIKRGVFWVRKVLCMPLDPPPADLDTTIKPNSEVTERRKVEAGTSSKACMGCHRFINPLGFMLENYGMLGEWRDQDANLPVDARVTMEAVFEDGPVSFSGPTDALTALTKTPRFRQCFARQMFRYYMGRREIESDDPVLREMFYELSQTGSIDSALKALVVSPSVSKRAK